MLSAAPKVRDASVTREKLLEAALASFSTRGFDASSTRQIEELAGVKRGLISYHFGSKLAIWEQAVGNVMEKAGKELGLAMDCAQQMRGVARLRFFVRAYVQFCAQYPEVNRLMIQEGMRDDARLKWLVVQHVSPWYANVSRIFDEACALGVAPAMDRLNFYYVLTGAATLIFSNALEAQQLAGVDTRSKEQVARHADMLANLLFSEMKP